MQVTTARRAALIVAPRVLEEHGKLTVRLVFESATRAGFYVSYTTFHRLLPVLASAGLIPADQQEE